MIMRKKIYIILPLAFLAVVGYFFITPHKAYAIQQVCMISSDYGSAASDTVQGYTGWGYGGGNCYGGYGGNAADTYILVDSSGVIIAHGTNSSPSTLVNLFGPSAFSYTGTYVVHFGNNGGSLPSPSCDVGQPMSGCSYNGNYQLCYNAVGSACNNSSFGYATYSLTAVGAPPSSVSFAYPTPGMTTAPFNNFVLTFGNLTSTDEYGVSINYFIPQTSYSNWTPMQTLLGGQLENYGLAVPRTALGLSTAASTTPEVAIAYLYDLQNFQIPDALPPFVVATGTTEFGQIAANMNGGGNGTTTYLYVLPFGNASTGITAVVTGTTTIPIGYVQNSTPVGTVYAPSCPAPTGITDIGGGIYWALCNAGYILFAPQTSIQTYLSNSYTAFQSAFPFSVIFGLHNLFSEAVASGTTSGASTISLTMPAFVPTIGGDTLTLVNSSTLKNAIGTNNFNTLFALEDALLWIFFAWLVYEIITK